MPEAIDADTARERVNTKEAVVIDVLGPDSFQEKHLPNAINIPLKAPDFEERVRQAVPDKDQPVIVYCASTTCDASPTAAKRLEDIGYRNVSDFEAGLAGWKEAGYRFEEPAATQL